MKVVNIGCFFLAGYYFRPAAENEKGEKYELAKTEASTDTSSVPSTDLWFLLQQKSLWQQTPAPRNQKDTNDKLRFAQESQNPNPIGSIFIAIKHPKQSAHIQFQQQ